MTQDNSKKDPSFSLSAADISAQPLVTRRALLSTLGMGVGVATVVAVGGGSLAFAADRAGAGRSCNFRDNDWSVRPQDKARGNCGVTDNDNSDRRNRSRTCGYRDSDSGGKGKYKDTVRTKCGKSDNDR